MKKLRFLYEMQLTFDAPVDAHRFTLKCIPKNTACQRILSPVWRITPNEMLCNTEDSFGNLCIYGYSKHPHTRFEVSVSGEACTGLSFFEPAEDDCHLGRYRYASSGTAPGPVLQSCHRLYTEAFNPSDLLQAEQLNRDFSAYPDSGISPESSEALTKSLMFMHWLYRDMNYQSGITNVNTTAEAALQLRSGVCQDYAHILIALCRMSGIPARYAAGMMIGEGKSHAWVEICNHGRWFALDPTNDQIAADQYIKISDGRDAHDCRINHGIFHGLSISQTQSVYVSVSELS